MHRLARPALLLVLFAFRSACGDEALDKLVYPLAKEPAHAPKIEVDVSEVSDDAKLCDWAAHSRTLCEAWLPLVCRFLAADDWHPPETIRLVMKKELAAPGVTSGATIEVSAKWVAAHPDDFGLVIHELTHVVQAYPRGQQPGWLVEGIADYIRYWRYEPERPHGPIGPGASYRDGYGTSAAFLAWLVQKYDHRIVHRLDEALRKGQDGGAVFQAATGRDVDALWKEFASEMAKRN